MSQEYVNKDCPRLAIIGAGRLGKTLGHLWSNSRVFSVVQVINTSKDSARDAAEFIGASSYSNHLQDLAAADYLMIAAPDNAIATIVQDLINLPSASQLNGVFHCSGVYSAKELEPINCELASVHPIRSFASPDLALKDFPGTYCALDGSKRLLVTLRKALEHIGANVIEISTEDKALYHLANVFASNLLIGLVDCSVDIYKKLGFAEEKTLDLLLPLVRGCIENLAESGVSKSLTGPIARGDSKTIAIHLEALEVLDSDIAQAYISLSKQILKLAARESVNRGSLAEIEEMLVSSH